MTREHAKELLPIIQAFADGEDIQFKGKDGNGWLDASDSPSFLPVLEWRIKPKPREFWILTSSVTSCKVGACHIVTDDPPAWVAQPRTIRVREIID